MNRRLPAALLLSACALHLGRAEVHAGALAPSKPSQVVSLISFGGTCPSGGALFGSQTPPDGNFPQPFTIPDGQVLVITEAQLTGSGATAGASVRILLRRETAAGGISEIVNQLVQADADGSYNGSFTFPTGVVVKAGALLCAKAVIGGGSFGSTGIVHGFLAQDR